MRTSLIVGSCVITMWLTHNKLWDWIQGSTLLQLNSFWNFKTFKNSWWKYNFPRSNKYLKFFKFFSTFYTVYFLENWEPFWYVRPGGLVGGWGGCFKYLMWICDVTADNTPARFWQSKHRQCAWRIVPQTSADLGFTCSEELESKIIELDRLELPDRTSLLLSWSKLRSHLEARFWFSFILSKT